ncbi:MAG: zinc dependent phospholipase C family protein [Lachnospiraceae bacterium]|nr:zinc dependent phospholipase C family protein [Lachnospiraceae bacterium]MDY4969567.1 zinc dependent phospholipase C family protein [Lachnospiraceae bacterium]
MPAIYAHYSFGVKVYRQLPGSLKKIIRNHKREYTAGLQGPDFLFFFNPLVKNRYGQLGHQIHEENASVFLNRAVKILKVTGMDSPEGAYIMGFICHFMLDSSCHGFVGQMVGETGESHTEQETEFDRYMMEKDGRCALQYPLYRLVDDSQELAETMSVFYKGVSTYTVRVSQERMRLIRRLLFSPGRLKRRILSGLLDLLFGTEREFTSFVMKTDANPACEEICRGLSERFECAVPECARIIEEFVMVSAAGSGLPKRFEKNFN